MKANLLLISAFALCISAKAQVPTSGLVANYPFTGNANDVSGNVNNAVVNGATLTTDRFGNINSAYSFDGINDDITSTFSSINTSYSLSFWYYTAVATFGKNLFETSSSYLVTTSNQKLDFAQNMSTGNQILTTNSTYTTNGWSHIVVSVDAILNQQKIYLNGVLDNSQTITGTLTSVSSLILGKRPNNTGYFNGKLDDVRIYNRSLTPAEVGQVYTDNCSASNVSTGLVAQYDFTGNANDLSGNGNNGLVNGATLTSDRFGNTNSAYSFNGTNNYINVLNNTSLNFSNNISLSISTWIKLSGSNANYSGIVTKMDGSGNGYQFIVGNNTVLNKLATEFGQGPTGLVFAGNQNLNDGNWHHVMYIVDRPNNKISFYVDNNLDAQVTTTTVSAANIDNTVNLKIGVERTMAYYFKGAMDDIRIYNKALSTCDIDSLFNMPNSISTGINKLSSKSNFIIYPNPVKENLTVLFNTNEVKPLNIELFDLLGNSIQQSKVISSLGENKIEINLNGLTEGVYLIKVENSVQRIQVVK